MPLVSIASFSIRDADGDTKSLPIYLPDTLTLANLQSFVDDFSADLDAAIAGVIDSVSVTVAATLPGGLRTTPVAGSEVERGALLSYSVEDSSYRWSYYIPTWALAGFAGNEVVNTGVYATLITDIASGAGSGPFEPTDNKGGDLVAFIEGKKRFRK